MEFLFFALLVVLSVIPFWTLLPHFGVNRNWALLAILPIGVLILLWVMWSKLREMEAR